MDRHAAAVQKIASSIRQHYLRRTPYRINHGSTNSTRPRPSSQAAVDISSLRHVLSVDTTRRTALVEPNVPMDRLVEATLPRGLIPPVVMEFPGITAGGGFAGTAGESSSFRHGFFEDTVRRVEMVLGDGDVVDTNRGDELFKAAAGSVGSFGIATALEVDLIRAKKYVRVGYRRVGGAREAVEVVRDQCEGTRDYVDGILFSKGHGVVVTGDLVDEVPAGKKVRTFSGAWDPWFYMHARDKRKGDEDEYVPLAEYLFRYDRGGFWVGESAFRYFGGAVPFNRWTRWWLDDFLHTRMLYRALHGSEESARMVVQDIAMPMETTEEFVEYTDKQMGIWPLWLCPLKRKGPPTFHPYTTPPGREGKEGELMMNVGVWGWGPKDPNEFVRKNRELEAKVAELGGMKWLYAHTYYNQNEFWPMYGGRKWYDALREEYHATTLPTVWDKVHVDAEAASGKQRHWLKKLPVVGGLWGIWKAIQSKDYLLHREATWKWKGDEKS
ncbi:hypothetical protein OQA88_10198 [Cercophora sp. LCS_1]